MKVSRLVALVLVAALLFFLFVWKPSGPRIADGSILVVQLRGEYVETAEPTLVARWLGDGSQTFASLLSELRKAERDDRIGAVVFRVRSLQIGWAQAEELRDAIADLRAAGRHTVAILEYASFGANIEYFVASAADEIYQSPATSGPLVGLAAEYFFLGGLWDRLGIDLEVERIGKYKSAADFIAGHEMTEAHREMASSLLDSIDGAFVAGIASSRKVDEVFVRNAIAAAPASPQEMLALGLVDGVAFYDEVLTRIGADAQIVTDEDYAAVDPARLGIEPVARFALVYGSGSVVMGDARSGPTGAPVLSSDGVSDAIDAAAEDPKVAAIIFRVDSPGGSALASDIVWRAIQNAREKGKPVIASFSDVAASGGYYVACGADAIVASAGTLTGSIGVVTLHPDLGGLFEKLDVGTASMTRGPHADLLVSTKPLSESSRERLRDQTESIYDLFVSRVAAGRKLSVDAVDAVGRGRVWTGAQAVDIGLVDALGGLRVAARRAKEMLGLDPDADVTLVPYPAPKGVFEQIDEALRRATHVSVGAGPLPSALRSVLEGFDAIADGAPVLVPPFLVEIE